MLYLKHLLITVIKNKIMPILRTYCKYIFMVTCLFYSSKNNELLGQCTGGNSITLQNYNNVSLVSNLTSLRELSGMTYVDEKGFVSISDLVTSNGVGKIVSIDYPDSGVASYFRYGTKRSAGGKVKQRTTHNSVDSPILKQQIFNIINIPLSTNPGCDSKFESITYVDTPNPNNSDVHRFALLRDGKIIILTVNLSLPITDVNYLSESEILNINFPNPNVSCQIESLAYDSDTQIMYVASKSKQIYYFDLEAAQLTPLIDLNMIDNANGINLNINTIAGMDMLPSGNLVLLTTYASNIKRKLIELDPCGSIISEFDLDDYFGNSEIYDAELEGIAYYDSELYLIGEAGYMFKLSQDEQIPILNVISPSVESIHFGAQFSIEWAISPVFNQGQIRIELYDRNSKIHTFTSSAPNDGSLIFTLPSDAPPGSFYRIRVTNTSDETITGFSTYFEIKDCTSDYDAMVAFANSITDWNGRQSWDLTQDMSTWHGVTTHPNGDVQSIDFDEDYIVGTIPPELGCLNNIESIELGDNNFSGPIPKELGNLNTLTWLNLSGNNLTGNIPAELGNLSSLEYLFLHYNQLSGIIPMDLGKLDNLLTLNLTSNDLTGSIPAEISNLSSLTNLSLSDNQLTGVIPTGIGNLSSLTSLTLSDNQLSGSIPSSFGSSSLIGLNLSNNQLSGCYDNQLLILCGQLNAGSNTNLRISDGNNFNIPWEDFCFGASCP